jgi:predicted permease
MLHDLRYALRTLRQNPGFALIAIVSLALGIGASAAMFSSADALVLRPLAVPNPAGVITVRAQLRGQTGGGVVSDLTRVSYRDYLDLRDRSRSFAGLAASQLGEFGFTADKDALPKIGELVTGNYFEVLGIQPVLGRGFQRDEDRVPGRDAVVVLGYDLWKNSFAASRDVLGRTLYLNGIAFTIVGVTPEPFNGSEPLLRSSLFVPIAMGPRLAGDLQRQILEDRKMPAMAVFGRLRPGATLAQAAAEAQIISRQLARAYPDADRTASLVVLSEMFSRLRFNPLNALLVILIMSLSGVVLLIACANVMNRMLSRARGRAREIAVRLAIGAGRGRLIRQLLTESLLIAALGGGLGLLVAQANAEMFSHFRIPGAIPIVFDLRLDSRVALFTLLVSIASALLFGLAPALRSTHPDLVPALKASKADGDRRRRFLGRNALVIAQVAGSLVLLVFATQAYRGARIVLSGPIGFRTDHVLMASFDPTLARYTAGQTDEFYKRLLERARTLPGVKSAGLAQITPMAAGNMGLPAAFAKSVAGDDAGC